MEAGKYALTTQCFLRFFLAGAGGRTLVDMAKITEDKSQLCGQGGTEVFSPDISWVAHCSSMADSYRSLFQEVGIQVLLPLWPPLASLIPSSQLRSRTTWHCQCRFGTVWKLIRGLLTSFDVPWLLQRSNICWSWVCLIIVSIAWKQWATLLNSTIWGISGAHLFFRSQAV